jgi:SAM-dependent methyltransferase
MMLAKDHLIYAMNIDYDHTKNHHTLEGPQAAFIKLFPDGIPKSLLDVGCGRGTWLHTAIKSGMVDVFGIDGVDIAPNDLLFPAIQFQQMDLTASINLGRRFDAILCLEVAEHLDEAHAGTLLDTLTQHANYIVFAGACPGQPGQHHVNCQWPAYWQQLFNHRGFVCSDEIRWRIWDMEDVEPWYKQNMFVALFMPNKAGKEARIRPVIHPEMITWFQGDACTKAVKAQIDQITQGCMSLIWYVTVPFRAAWGKVLRRFLIK